MKCGAEALIRSRQAMWQARRDSAWDGEFRQAVALRLLEDPALLAEVRQYPEKLIQLVFVLVDKNQQTVPFFLNPVQKSFLDTLNRAREAFAARQIPEISLLVLKGRQQGFTTLVTAYQLACSILQPNFQGFTLADTGDNAEAIFQHKAKFPYTQLPECLKPTEKYNNRRQLAFDKLNSAWTVDTASRDVGRSRTVNFFHGSECAFWKDGIAPVQAALGEAFTANCIKIYESTANGYNDYRKMWQSGTHINCFYPWWLTEEYRIPFPDRRSRQRFLQAVDAREGWLWQRLRWLRGEKYLDPEQLHWYQVKFDSFLDKDRIRQEYPCSAQEAFLLSGRQVFDPEAILRRLDTLPPPRDVGSFHYDYDGRHIRNIRWISDPQGCIQLYAIPEPAVPYCIGGDTAGDGSDFFTGHVLDARTGCQVAHLKHPFDADQYTRQIYCLGKFYGEALLCIEANFDSFPLRELQRLEYPNLYVRMAQDTYTGRTEKRIGFRTTSITRPVILSRLVEIVREHCDTICDRATLEELLTIVRNEKGRIEAPAGGHDDDMMGLAIAHEAREQALAVYTPRKTSIQDPWDQNLARSHWIQEPAGEKLFII